MELFLKLKEVENQLSNDTKDSQDWFRVKFNNLAKVMLHFYYRIRQFCAAQKQDKGDGKLNTPRAPLDSQIDLEFVESILQSAQQTLDEYKTSEFSQSQHLDKEHEMISMNTLMYKAFLMKAQS